MEAAACTATAWAPASVTTCPAAFQVASSGCPAGIGRVWAIVWSFLSLRTRRESPAIRLSRGAGKEAMKGLSLAAAAALVSLRCPGRGGAGRVITRDEHGGGRAAAAGPGTRLG